MQVGWSELTTMQLRITLNGSSAAQALETIRNQGGRFLWVTRTQENVETIVYQLPNGRFCTIGTDRIPSYGGLGVHGDPENRSNDPLDELAEELIFQLKTQQEAGIPIGHAVEDLVLA